jgi:tetratricopeptide (TPR) repeat protein
MMKYLMLPLSMALVIVIAYGAGCSIGVRANHGQCQGCLQRRRWFNPLVQAEVEWTSTDTGHKYDLKTNKKGEYFSLGITPGKYNVVLRKDGKELFHINGVTVGLDEVTTDIDLKKEQASAAQGQGLTPEQAKARADAAAKVAAENKTVGTLNDKLKAARAAEEAKDYDTAISTLNEANQIDATRDPIWYELANAYLNSASKQTDPAEKQKRYEMAAADYQKAIDLRTASELAQKDPENNKKMAAYYNNMAQAYSKSSKIDDAVADYTKAATVGSDGRSLLLLQHRRRLHQCRQGR